MITEVGLADCIEPGDSGHEVVVDPEATHRVVGGGVDPHGHLVGILIGDAVVHLEEVAVPILDGVVSIPSDGRLEIEIDPVLERPNTLASVDHPLGGPGGHVAGDEVSEGRIDALQVVVTVCGRDVAGRSGLVGVLGYPDPSVVAERLRHQGQLRLEFIRRRDAGGVDLSETRVGEGGAPAVCPPCRRDVRGHRIGGEIEDVGITAGGQHHGVCRVAGYLTRDQISDDDSDRPAVFDDDVEHLTAGVEVDLAGVDLTHQCRVGTEQELLAGCTSCVEGSRHLGATERSVVEQSAVLPGKRNTLCCRLIDDVQRDLGETMNVGLSTPVVTALDRVVKEAIDRVSVVVIVLRSVDPSLGGDGVSPSRRVMEGENVDLVAKFAERRRSGSPGETRPDDEDLELPLVVRADEPDGELVVFPLGADRPCGNLGVELQCHSLSHETE